MIDLKTIRIAADLTQAEMAERLGLTAQTTVSQIERRDDWKLSTLAAYINAAGGTAALVVTVNGDEMRFPLK